MKGDLGIDVSHHQGAIDWPAVAKAGIQFAYCKATEGVDYVDPMYYHNISQASDIGLAVGAYHFARVGATGVDLSTDARAEAQDFATCIDRAPYFYDRPPVLDIEWDKRSKDIEPPNVVAWCLEFLREVQAITGRTCMVYTGPNFWRYRMARSTALFSWPLWLASYKRSPQAIPGWQTTVWQYTGKGTIAGVRGHVDRNRQMASFANVDLSEPIILDTRPGLGDALAAAAVHALQGKHIA